MNERRNYRARIAELEAVLSEYERQFGKITVK